MENVIETIIQTSRLFALLKKWINACKILSEAKYYITIFFGCILVTILAMTMKYLVGLYCHFGKQINDKLSIICFAKLSLIICLIISKKPIAKAFVLRTK
jgi:hypothetical protein